MISKGIMFFCHRYNCMYRDLRSHAEPGVMVSHVSSDGSLSEPVYWLGAVDRKVARNVRVGRQVVLDLEAWRLGEFDANQWMKPGEYFVGFLVSEGVFVVTDGRKPLIKTMRFEGQGDHDRLGRTIGVDPG